MDRSAFTISAAPVLVTAVVVKELVPDLVVELVKETGTSLALLSASFARVRPPSLGVALIEDATLAVRVGVLHERGRVASQIALLGYTGRHLGV